MSDSNSSSNTEESNSLSPQDSNIMNHNNDSSANKPSHLFVITLNLCGGWGSGGGGGGGKGGGLPFGNDPDIPPTKITENFKLENIGGLDEQIDYLKRSVILPLICPKILQDWGIRPPKGILFYGPPGTGKTLLAKAIVYEIQKETGQNVSFFYRKGGDVYSMWMGESQKNLRAVFTAAKSKQPSVIFFDEIDGLCPSRERSDRHGSEIYNSVVTTFLGEMDGLESKKVFVIAATNRVEAVDPAVRRPGRFDKQLGFSFPDEESRARIINIHTQKWTENDKPEKGIVQRIAKSTIGFSGADLEKLAKEVVLLAMEEYGEEFNNDVEGKFKITEKQWLQAINQMQRTASDIFKSALYMPVKPNPTISRLIEPIVTKVANIIQPIVAQEEADGNSWNSILLHPVKKLEGQDFLNCHIIDGILSHLVFNKVSIFKISPKETARKVMTGEEPSVQSAILTVVNQALDASLKNFVCLLVMDIDIILSLAKSNKTPPCHVLTTLEKMRGPRRFVLATSPVSPDIIKEPEPRIMEFFSDKNYIIQIENPKEDHLRQIFEELLQKKIANQNEEAQNSLADVVKQAAENSKGDSYEDILNLMDSFEKVEVDADGSMVDYQTRILNVVKRYLHFKGNPPPPPQ